MPASANNNQAKRAAILAATMQQIQGGAAALAWNRQIQGQVNAQDLSEVGEISGQLEMQRNEARATVARAQGQAASSEQQTQQQAIKTELKGEAVKAVKTYLKRAIVGFILANLPTILVILLIVAILAIVVTAAGTHPWDTFVQFGFAPFKVIWDLMH